MSEEHVFDLLPGYALGCLDEQDLLEVARHLPRCATCRSELATYWTAADQLALVAPLRTPSSELKQKIMRRVEQKAAPVQPAPARAASIPVAPRRGVWAPLASLLAHPAGLALGAVALLIILFMGVSNFLLWQRVNALQARVPQGTMQLVRLEGTPHAPQAQGYLMVFANETYGTLVVENAPPLAPGYQYQLWLVRDGKRTNGGVFSVSSDGYGTLEVSADQPLETYPSFGITIEPAGGSPTPTGNKVLGGKF